MSLWGGICCLSGAALYLLGRRCSGGDANALSSVTRVNQLKDLAQLFDTASKPLVVAISGRVGAETPINCRHSGLRGVIVHESAEQLFLKLDKAWSWIQDSVLMFSTYKDVPWYMDDETGRVFVTEVRGASGLALQVGSEVFEESVRSFLRGTLDYLRGLKMIGVKRIERVLPTGTVLTVVGEVVKDKTGSFHIQRPLKGPFYVSQKSIEQLLGNSGNWARWYTYASLGFTVFGVCLIARHAFIEMERRHDHEEMRERVLAAAAKKSGQEDEGNLCVICLEHEYNAVFVPCGHMCCCLECSSNLTDCPLCRTKIDQIVKTFLH